MIVRSDIGGGDLRGYGEDEPGYRKYGYDGYGTIGCTDLNTCLANLNATVGAAAQAGVPSTDPDYVAASNYANAPPWFDFYGSTCVADTANCNQLYAALTAKIRAAGATPPPPVQGAPSFLDSLNPLSGSGGGVPGWAIGLIAVAGIIGLGWLASSGAKIYTTAKKAKSLASPG